MSFTLPPLPYAENALEPHCSAEIMSYHYGKHHAGYVSKVNAAVAKDSSLAGKTMEEVMASSSGGLFNSAAQCVNHTFYWSSMKPNPSSAPNPPTGAIADAINASFGDFDKFKSEFSTLAAGHFGSGWAWLVKDGSGLKVVGSHDASNPWVEKTGVPLLTCDVWEHAYYLQYKNQRPAYIEAWWSLVNWDFANANLAAASL